MIERLESFETKEVLDEWTTVDDVVMGGRSSSRVRWIESEVPGGPSTWLRFEGTVSLENDGGFCSARQTTADRGEPGLSALRLTVRGDGGRYQWTIRTRSSPEGASWRYSFSTDETGWETFSMPLDMFELWRRGTRLEPQSPLESSDITSFGMLISDRQEGEFRIDVAEIAGIIESA